MLHSRIAYPKDEDRNTESAKAVQAANGKDPQAGQAPDDESNPVAAPEAVE